ncbi:MAG: acylphosphatase [Leptospirales bacterium]|jgi:acylphosphatase|nr:acylphosphatase [Leptospirales bacterium]
MIKKIILKGQVQGVGCRGYCARYAKKSAIHGSATNLRDGTVRLILEAENESIFQRFISSLLSNPDGYMFYGTIRDIDVSDYSGKIEGDYNF